jgi:OOP family OmpA-OmpF porin
MNEVERLNSAPATGSPFTQALAAEYRSFANSELNQMLDFPDALHFARKGLAAAAGQNVRPDPVSDWNLSADESRELGAARGRLIVALDQGARETNPAATARAQVGFDCWIENQEEGSNIKDIDTCKNKFSESLGQIESDLKPAAAPPAQESSVTLSPLDVDPARPMAPENAMYLVFFNWNKSDLADTGLGVIDAVAQEVKKNAPPAISIIGHTDTSGSKKYNQRLALKRANAVCDALVARGVDANLIHTDAKGEDSPLVQTNDDVREPANRRVNISFQ